MTKPTDRHLAESCLEGVQQHCRLLFDRYNRQLLGYFRKRVANIEDAKDLTQETFIRAFEGLKGFNWESSFKTWLYTIAMNVSRDHHRKQHARMRSGVEMPIGDEDGIRDIGDDNPGRDVHRLVETKERTAALNQAIRQLPERQREVLLLRQQGFKKYDEIARILGIQTNTVGTNLNAALKNLKLILKKYLKDS